MSELFHLLLAALLLLAATSLGASLVWLLRKIGDDANALLLSLSAGAMGYSVLEMFLQSHRAAGDLTALAGLLLGIGALAAFERALPHLHSILRSDPRMPSQKKAVLLAGSITLHNVPEGLAVGTAFASSTPLGWVIALSIALQDIPEGLLVSAPLSAYKFSARKAFGFGALSGAVEAAAALAGFLFLSIAGAVIPLALSVSSGAMAYVILVEMVPDAMRGGRERLAVLGMAAGFAAAALLAGLFSA